MTSSTEDAWALIRTVDRGRVFLDLRRSIGPLSQNVIRHAGDLVMLADAEPDGDVAAQRCAEAICQGAVYLRPFVLDLLSVHRAAIAVDLLHADIAAEGVPDGLEVEIRIAAEAVRSTVDLHRRLEEGTSTFHQALRILRTCAKRIVAYAERFGTLTCSPESGEPMHWHRQREKRENSLS
jgi:hypothetical protein